jgi:hypothetical protein
MMECISDFKAAMTVAIQRSLRMIAPDPVLKKQAVQIVFGQAMLLSGDAAQKILRPEQRLR